LRLTSLETSSAVIPVTSSPSTDTR
jgi:hypothetical protein